MKIIKEFVLRTVAGEHVLIPTGKTSQEFNGMITLSPSAAFIWENLEKVDSLEEMTEKITQEFDVDAERARHDAYRLIGEFIRHGMIQQTKEDMSW